MSTFRILAWLAACSTPEPSAPAPPPAPASGSEHAAEHAGGEHAHGAPHGGIVRTVGDIHVEALMMPSGVMFYLSDKNEVPLGVDGYTGTAAVKGPGGLETVDLMPMGDHLHAAVPLVQGQPASAVLTVTHEGKASSASFETSSVGLQSHDHVALHGGQVGMWGNYHLEYLPKAGEYRVWVTDANRNPIAGTVTGTIKDGSVTVPLVAGEAGAMSAKGEGAGTRPVTVEVTADGTTFSLGFDAVQGSPPDVGATPTGVAYANIAALKAVGRGPPVTADVTVFPDGSPVRMASRLSMFTFAVLPPRAPSEE